MSEFEYDLPLQNVKLFQLLGDFVPRSPAGLRPGPTGEILSPRSPQYVHPPQGGAKIYSPHTSFFLQNNHCLLSNVFSEIGLV